MSTERVQQYVSVTDGEVPVAVAGRPDGDLASGRPAVVCVPSIFGANDDLIAQMASLADVATAVIMDPFWRVEAGAIPYAEREVAFARVGKLDRAKTTGDVEAVARWLAAQTNGKVIGLGICFGGPQVLLGAAAGWLDGVVTWHGSRMEQVLDRVAVSTVLAGVPMRHHLGDADPITPPEAIDALRAAFADHGDCEIVVHPGADHGFSHEGEAWDPDAAEAGLSSLRRLAMSTTD